MKTAVTSCWPALDCRSPRLPATWSMSSMVPKAITKGSSTASMKALAFCPDLP